MAFLLRNASRTMRQVGTFNSPGTHATRAALSTKCGAVRPVVMTMTVLELDAVTTVMPEINDVSSVPVVVEETHASRVQKARQSVTPVQLNTGELYVSPRIPPQKRQPIQTIGGLCQELHELCADRNKAASALATSSSISASALNVLSRIPRGRGARGSRRSRSSSRSERPKAVPLLGDYVNGSFDVRQRKLMTLELIVQKLGSNGILDFYKAASPQHRLVAIQGHLFEPNIMPSLVAPTSTAASSNVAVVDPTRSSVDSHPLDELFIDDDTIDTIATTDSTTGSSGNTVTAATSEADEQQADIQQAEDTPSSSTQQKTFEFQLARLQTVPTFVKADLGGAAWSSKSSSLFCYALYCKDVLGGGADLSP